MANSGTVPKQLRPFVKGDPRINRLGRPKTFDAARALAQQIAHEVAKAGGHDVIVDNHRVTIAEAVLRSWATSKDARLQMAFMEWAYGKPRVEVTGANGGAIRINQGVDLRKLTDEELATLTAIATRLADVEGAGGLPKSD